MWLEEKVRPVVTGNTLTRDLLAAALLAGLAVILLSQPLRELIQGHLGAVAEAIPGAAMVTLDWYLLMAMGFALALRRGAIDLSLWAVSALGGLVAALLIRQGMAPALALASGAIAGLAVGAAHGSLVSVFRLPSPLVTLASAILLVQILPILAGPAVATDDGRDAKPRVLVPKATFQDWQLLPPARQEDSETNELDKGESVLAPRIQYTRMVLAGAVYTLVMISLMFINAHRAEGFHISSQWQMFWVLAVSGMLSAAGGALWLLNEGYAPLPTRLVDDLRPVAAAVLAGGALLAGRGRTMLVLVLLPLASYLALHWRQDVWQMTYQGYEIHMFLLVFTLLGFQVGVRQALAVRTVGRGAALAGLALMGVGIALIAETANLLGIYVGGVPASRLFSLAGLGAWLVGVVLVALCRSWTDRSRREERPARAAITPPEA